MRRALSRRVLPLAMASSPCGDQALECGCCSAVGQREPKASPALPLTLLFEMFAST